jgi:outer membrane protein assembly factor BamA
MTAHTRSGRRLLARASTLALLAAVGLTASARSEGPRVGAKVTIRAISFDGNSFMPTAVLNRHIKSSANSTDPARVYDQKTVDADVAGLEADYRAFGYLAATVTCERQWSHNRTEVRLVFHIEERQRYPVKETTPLDELLKNAGRLVEEPPLLRVGQIFVTGNELTRQDVILQQVALYPGQILRQDDLRQAEEDLIRLDRFAVDTEKGIRPTLMVLENTGDPTNPYRDILITIKEKETSIYLNELCGRVAKWVYVFSPRTYAWIAAAYLRSLSDPSCR